MIAYLYRLPGWFLSPDDKPTYQVFQAVLSNVTASQVECETITTPTLSTISVQSTISTSSFNTFDSFQAFNYIKYKSNWYQITEVTYVSDNNQVIEINGTIDLYLTWVVSMFNEEGTVLDATIVYFNQKHLNRFVYNTSLSSTSPPKMVLYQYQFYLMGIHETLKNVGSKKNKSWYHAGNYTYNTSTVTNPQPTLYQPSTNVVSTLAGLQVYPIILWIETSQEQYVNVNPYEFPFAIGGIGRTNQPVGWWLTNQYILPQYYSGVYLMPTPLNTMCEQLNTTQATSTVQYVTGMNALGSPTNYDPAKDIVLRGDANLYYVVANAFNADYVTDGSIIEPAILNFNHCNVRMYGQDNTVNLTAFNYYTTNIDSTTNPARTIIEQLYLYLGSFCITISPPNMTLTNIPFCLYSRKYNANSLGLADILAWNYNPINDAIFSIIMKAEAPSTTNAWSQYMANNKNNYEMGLNIAQLMAQNAQASVKMAHASYGGSIASYDNVFSDLLSIVKGSFGSQVANTYNLGIESNTIAPNDANIQQDKLNYIKTGMKADYSRVSNLRVSASSNINTLYDSSYIWIYEYIPQYEQVTVSIYYELNVYLLDRWDAWGNWNNRAYCNYVKCSQWCNALGTYIPLSYRSGVDHLFNVGFRVWSKDAFNGTYSSVPYSSILVNSNNGTYNNVERNENNNEVCYLCDVDNDTLIAGGELA